MAPAEEATAALDASGGPQDAPPEAPVPSAHPEAGGPPAMSKSQMKKQMRRESRKARSAAKREVQRATRRQAQAAKHVEVRSHLEAMSEEDLAAWRAQRKARVDARRAGREAMAARLTQAQQSGQRVVIDLEFADKMTEGELRSICQQVSYCYHDNANAALPAHLILTGMSGMMGETVRRQISGVENWIVTRSEQPLEGHFAGSIDQLVYLTADSPHELQELDPGKAYIIGGIVDRNRHKNLCQEKATALGIATARLPIGDHLQLSTSQVLCTNHVFAIMVKWLEMRDWGAAFRAVIPTRKRKAVEREGGAGAQGEEEGDEGAQGGEGEPAGEDGEEERREGAPAAEGNTEAGEDPGGSASV